MTTIDSVLRRSLDDRSGDLILTLDPAFQGLPDTAHGGSVLAAFDTVAGLSMPRAVSGVYRKRVPLATPLRLAVGRDNGAHTFVLRDSADVLADGRVAPLAPDARDRGVPGLLGDPCLLRGGERSAHETSATGSVASVVSEGPRRATVPAHPLPVSRTCFACGVANELGLRAQLEFNDAEVRGTWKPRAPFRTAGGALTTAALTTLCDETAFWIGALATGESGMTTDLAVTLHRAVPFDAALTVTGSRAAALPRADPRYWETEVVARTEDRTLVASARITFAVARGAAGRLVRGMLAMNDPAVVARVFPAYAH